MIIKVPIYVAITDVKQEFLKEVSEKLSDKFTSILEKEFEVPVSISTDELGKDLLTIERYLNKEELLDILRKSK